MKKIDDLKTSLHHICSISDDPVLMWSGGKDSTLLLYLIQELKLKVSVISFFQLWTREQKKFIMDVIRSYSLQVFTYHPIDLQFYEKHLVAYYIVAGKKMPVIMDHFHRDSVCGLDLGKNVLTEKYPKYVWDTTIIGTKKTDKHILIKNGYNFEEFNTENHSTVFPLWDWDDEEVLTATKLLGVPINKKAYEDDNQVYDTGSFTACMNCVNNDRAFCPKIGETIVGIRKV